MRRDYLIAGISIIVFVFVLSRVLNDDASGPHSDEGPIKKAVPILDPRAISDKGMGISSKASDLGANVNDQSAADGQLNASAENDKTLTFDPEEINKFQEHIETVVKCVSGDRPRKSQDQVTPSLEGMLGFVQGEFGDFVLNIEDWTQVDYTYPNGTKKRVRIDTTHLDEQEPKRELSVVMINDSGQMEYQKLDPAQAVDPSEEYLRQVILGEDGQIGKVELREKSQRFFFPGREELVTIDRDGRLDSFTVIKNGKTAHCSGLSFSLSGEKSICQCY